MLYIEQFVYTNKMREVHSLEKLGFALLTMIICLASSDRLVIPLLTTLIMSCLLVAKARIPLRVLLKLFSIPLGFLLISAITIALTISKQPEDLTSFIRLGDFYLGFTTEGLRLAIQTTSVSLGAVSCLYFLALTTPTTELLYSLRLIKLPSLLIELMTLIYRFIFLFLETALQIYTAQSSRWGYSNMRRSFTSLGLLLANVWGKAYFKSRQLYTGMLSRGYENELKLLNPKMNFSARTLFLFVTTDLLLLILAII